jgi:hypothetical protein
MTKKILRVIGVVGLGIVLFFAVLGLWAVAQLG